ncbi:efflux RND transporter permease subunit [Entomospira entomophila]|uniref:Efflux RND transporter permease subunit n=1 Tax=Entomospira entomophila TaxID=2719988 RepID=A0A968KU65_9SPIO|nr:efflux RND transporter permease subunit [Entomospira entomophilus]NIZ41131.1 efflux RND transporter permease subunit [Entomospira entomophilus]WDI35338.1 efflux RND transporter permease subunit [Entomospira entomophilus]
MSMVKTLINKPVSVVVLSSLVLIISLFMLTLIPQELTPEMDFPTISVITRYIGAGPEEVESGITEILESAFLSISGVTEITSTSSENVSRVSINFDWDRDLDAATNDIRDKIDLVRNSLPEDADNPVIFRLNINTMIPVISMRLSGLDMSGEELKAIAEDSVVPYIEQLNGVASVDLFGGRERQVRVEVIQNRLEAYNITMNEVAQVLAAQNIQISAGSIDMDASRLLLRTAGEFSNLQDVEDVIVAYRPLLFTPATTIQGSSWANTNTNVSANDTRMIPVRIRDIADVHYGFADAETYSAVNGEAALILNITRQSGSNAVDIARLLRSQMPVFNDKLPNGLELEILYDTSRLTSNSIARVVESALSGLVLIVIVLLLFLRNVKSALIVSITMPLSIFTTVMFMYLFDLTLNLMSLTGLTLGVGMIVDSSIVIIENIYRYREKGVKATTAAHLGTSEMIMAITASTLTTVAVFLPMVIFQRELEIVGVLFGDLAFTIVIALFSSLVFSVTVVPVLAGTFLAIDTPKQKPLKGVMARVDKVMERFLNWMDAKYARGIEWSLNHKFTVIFVSFGALAASIMILRSPLIGTELMPSMDSQTVEVTFELPVDSTLEATAIVGRDFTKRMNEAFDSLNVGTVINYYILTVGGSSLTGAGEPNSGTLTMVMDDEFHNRPLSSDAVQDLARQLFHYYPDITFSFGSRGFGSGAAFELNITGNDQNQLRLVSEEIATILEGVPQIREPSSDLEDGIPESIIVPNRDMIGSMGVAIASIGSEIRTNINGNAVSVYRADGDEIDIYLILREEDRLSIRDLDRIYVNSPITGTRMPVSNLVSIQQGISPVSIVRKNQVRQATVTANAALRSDGTPYPAGLVSSAAWQAINQEYVPVDGIMLREGGGNQDFIDLIPTLIAVVFVSIILVYGIMASQFESLKDPFIIILTIATMPIGPILIYAITRQPFSTFSIIGMIMLVGIVVNTGIILVDYTNLLRKRGMALREAVIETGRLRLRPILMTTLTTVLGMIPMATATGDGTAMTKPIGITVVGGMISSSIMTLFLVPVLYYLFNQRNEKKNIEKIAKERKILEDRRKSLATEE